MYKQGPHFPTTTQKTTPWQDARQQREQQTLFPVVPMPDMSEYGWEEPPAMVAPKAKKQRQRKAWLAKHQEMKG